MVVNGNHIKITESKDFPIMIYLYHLKHKNKRFNDYIKLFKSMKKCIFRMTFSIFVCDNALSTDHARKYCAK